MEYELSDELKVSLQKEVEGKGNHNRKVVFMEIAKQVFPDIRSTALLINDKLDLYSFNFDKVEESRRK